MIKDHIKGKLTLGGERLVDTRHAAQQAQLRAAERKGKRVAVQFAKPKKPWGDRK